MAQSKDILRFARLLAYPFLGGEEAERFEPRHVHVIKIGAIGDVLMATPALRALRERFPEARLTVSVGSWARRVLEGNPHVDELVELDDFELYRPKGQWARLKTVGRWLSTIRRMGPDVVVVWQRAWQFNLVALLSGAGFTVGFDREGEGFCLDYPCEPIADLHETDNYTRTLECFGVTGPSGDLEFHCSLEEAEQVEALFADFPTEGSLIGLVAGGSGNPKTRMPSRRWPIEHYTDLCQLLLDKGFRVVMFGSAADAESLVPLCEQYSANSRVLNLVGRTSLGEFVSAASRCALVVTNDGGPMHLAAVSGTRVLSLFGPTNPSELAPREAGCEYLVRSLDCSPCYRDGDFPDCGHRQCLSSISAHEVMARILRMLGPEVQRALQ